MLIALLEFRVTITAVARVSMEAGGIITQTRTCRIYMRLIHTSYLILVMEATTTKTPMVLHTITMEMGIPNTLLLVKLPRSRDCE